MKKNDSNELRAEYRRKDFDVGVRGKHLDSYRKGSVIVILDPDVAKTFPTSKSVNETLLSLMRIAQNYARRSKLPRPSVKSTK